LIYLLHAWGEDETSLAWVAERIGGSGEKAICLRGTRRADNGFAWASWDSDDPRALARARRRVERSIEPGAILVGFSQGAMLALEVAFAGETRLRAVVGIGAYLAPGGLARPRARVHRGPPLLLLHGRDDDVVAPADTEKALARLASFTRRAELRFVKGGHEVTPAMVRSIRDFLADL
jgi:predicted esterase